MDRNCCRRWNLFHERHRVTDLDGLIAIMRAPDAALEYEPVAAARMLRGVTLAMSHPALIGDVPMTPQEIVSLLLDGIRSR